MQIPEYKPFKPPWPFEKTIETHLAQYLTLILARRTNQVRDLIFSPNQGKGDPETAFFHSITPGLSTPLKKVRNVTKTCQNALLCRPAVRTYTPTARSRSYRKEDHLKK